MLLKCLDVIFWEDGDLALHSQKNSKAGVGKLKTGIPPTVRPQVLERRCRQGAKCRQGVAGSHGGGLWRGCMGRYTMRKWEECLLFALRSSERLTVPCMMASQGGYFPCWAKIRLSLLGLVNWKPVCHLHQSRGKRDHWVPWKEKYILWPSIHKKEPERSTELWKTSTNYSISMNKQRTSQITWWEHSNPGRRKRS